MVLALVPSVMATAASAKTQNVAKAAAAGLPCTTAAVQAAVKLPHVSVSSAVNETSGSFTPPGTTTPITGLPDFCQVSLVQTDSAGNPINIVIWLPAKWNGNFQGVGGGGYSCGVTYTDPDVGGSLQDGVENGYATGSTDCGVPPSDGSTGAWALKPNGTLNWPLIQDFASLGMHDMSVAGKAVTSAFYAHRASYSYFYGCSTGGREGLMEAQRYPADYNGIVSGAPAINWTEFIPSEIWPELVMNQSHDFLPTCKEDAFTDAVDQGLRGRPGRPGLDQRPGRLPLEPVQARRAQDTVRHHHRRRRRRDDQDLAGTHDRAGPQALVRAGTRRQPGRLAGTTTSAAGVTTGVPFPITVSWLGLWLQQDPSWNWATLTYAQF